VDEENRVLEVIVADDQLSLAIGKRGQNVSLAARLTGCRIDIKSEVKAAEAELQAYASFDGTQSDEEENGQEPAANEEADTASGVEASAEVEPLAEGDVVETEAAAPEKSE
jgi:N utilization substance protein A